MSDNGIIIEHDEHPDFRARIVHDDTADAPEFEEGVPTYRVIKSRDYSGVHGSRLEHVYGRRSDVVEYAWNRLTEPSSNHATRVGDAADILDRYLRTFHDGAAASVWGRDEEDYIVAVTREELTQWNADHSAADEVRAAHDGEYFAYLAGDVYGVVIERKVIEHTEIRDMSGQVRFVTEREAWEQVDSVWGFYGDPSGDDYAGSYIRSEARDMIALADH